MSLVPVDPLQWHIQVNRPYEADVRPALVALIGQHHKGILSRDYFFSQSVSQSGRQAGRQAGRQSGRQSVS